MIKSSRTRWEKRVASEEDMQQAYTVLVVKDEEETQICE
jgi:hypothetical protein